MEELIIAINMLIDTGNDRNIMISADEVLAMMLDLDGDFSSEQVQEWISYNI